MMQNNTLFSPEIRKLDKRFGSKYPMVDCHVHAVNFQQKTPGLAKLIEYMDETQLLAAVVF
jgi:hypothetical protein